MKNSEFLGLLILATSCALVYSSSETNESSYAESGDSSQPRCRDPNSEYSDCASVCPKTCSDWWEPITCDACGPGCACKDGYVLNKHKRCVPISKCPKPVCKAPNRYYTDCGTACPKSCKNWWYYDQIGCTKQCVRGCFCKDGLVEDGNGNCVKTSQCPEPVCDDPNREFKECGSDCPDTCKSINDPNRICTKKCVKGCFCKFPLVEDANGNCIDRSQCPNPTCPDPNRYYTDCGSACPLSCTNRCKEFACIQVCVEGCYCRPGLIDDGYGNCTNPKKCPADACQCERNAEWKECGTCDGTCWDPYPDCSGVECRPGCFCPRGFLRNNQDVCVPRRQCLSNTASPGPP